MQQSTIDVSGLRLQPQGENRLGQGIAAFGAGLAEMSRKRKEAEKVKQFTDAMAPTIAKAFNVAEDDARKAIGADPQSAIAAFQTIDSAEQRRAAEKQKAHQQKLSNLTQLYAQTGDANILAALPPEEAAQVQNAGWALSNQMRQAYLAEQTADVKLREAQSGVGNEPLQGPSREIQGIMKLFGWDLEKSKNFWLETRERSTASMKELDAVASLAQQGDWPRAIALYNRWAGYSEWDSRLIKTPEQLQAVIGVAQTVAQEQGIGGNQQPSQDLDILRNKALNSLKF